MNILGHNLIEYEREEYKIDEIIDLVIRCICDNCGADVDVWGNGEVWDYTDSENPVNLISCDEMIIKKIIE